MSIKITDKKTALIFLTMLLSFSYLDTMLESKVKHVPSNRDTITST